MSMFTDTIQFGKDKEGNKILIRRCNANLCSIKAYRTCINQEIEQGKKLLHPNLPEYIGLQTDDTGEYIAFNYAPAITIQKALLDSSFQINSSKKTDDIVAQLLDVVEYLHRKGICHLNINPQNILITKGKRQIYLFNPLNTYIKDNITYATLSGEYSAPELLLNKNISYQLCDIYSIGKVMEFLYSYSRLTPWISYIIKKATEKDVDKRYGSIAELRKDFLRIRTSNYIISAAKLAVVAGILFAAYLGLKDDDIDKENYEFREQTRHMQPQSTSIETTPALTGSNGNDIPLPDSIIKIDRKSEMMAEQIFKKEFKKEAIKVVNSVYNKELMNSTPEKFQKVSLDGFTKLDKLQKEMAQRYNMSVAYTTQLSSEVIDELTKERMNEINKKH